MRPDTHRSLPGLVAAWLVHAYTASGAVCAFLALIAALDHDLRRAFGWLILQVVIDATDGLLARAVRVSERLPQFSGAHLDDIVDYLTYVFVPAFIVWHEPLVPPSLALPLAAAVIVSSAYGFSRTDAKTSDHYFTGFPSYWNILVFYFVALGSSPTVNAAWVALFAALVFVPIRYLYPSRTIPFIKTTNVIGALWGAGCILMLLWMPDVPGWLRLHAFVFPIYYVALSLVLHWRSRHVR
jgi:phosphatidylcholine synthase